MGEKKHKAERKAQPPKSVQSCMDRVKKLIQLELADELNKTVYAAVTMIDRNTEKVLVWAPPDPSLDMATCLSHLEMLHSRVAAMSEDNGMQFLQNIHQFVANLGAKQQSKSPLILPAGFQPKLPN